MALPRTTAVAAHASCSAQEFLAYLLFSFSYFEANSSSSSSSRAIALMLSDFPMLLSLFQCNSRLASRMSL